MRPGPSRDRCRRRRRVRGAVLLGLPAALALGVAGQQLVHAVRAHRVGVGVARVRGRRSAGGSGAGRACGSAAGRRRRGRGAPRGKRRRRGPTSGSSVPSAPNVVERRGEARVDGRRERRLASRRRAQAGPASPARWSVRAHRRGVVERGSAAGRRWSGGGTSTVGGGRRWCGVGGGRRGCRASGSAVDGRHRDGIGRAGPGGAGIAHALAAPLLHRRLVGRAPRDPAGAERARRCRCRTGSGA